MNFKQILKLALNNVLNLVFPPRCLSCLATVDTSGVVCHKCWSKMEFIAKPCCARCSNPFPYNIDEELCYYCKDDPPSFSNAFAVVKYDDFSDKLIYSLKYYDRTDLASTLSAMMISKIAELAHSIDIITCVPIHKNKLKKRGYNQAALLAKHVANAIGKPFNPSILIKTKDTISQSGLSKEERKENVKHSFGINAKHSKKVFRKNVLIIDDVITTGATLNECCKKLKRAGAKKLVVLTFAKTCL